MIKIEIGGEGDLRRLADRFRRAGGRELSRRLKVALYEGIQPMHAQAQINVLNTPTHGDKHTGLRGKIARALEVNVSDSTTAAAKVTLQVDPDRMPTNQRTLPRYVEGFGRWRHPLFGNRRKWYGQSGHPWFRPAVREHLKDVRRAVENLVDKIAREIERG